MLFLDEEGGTHCVNGRPNALLYSCPKLMARESMRAAEYSGEKNRNLPKPKNKNKSISDIMTNIPALPTNSRKP